MESQKIAEQAERLRRARDFDAALAFIANNRVAGADPVSARAVKVSEAKIHREYGSWSRSAECFLRAASLGDQDPWLEAEAFTDRYWDASANYHDNDSDPWSGVVAALASRLSRSTTDAERAPFHWASARIKMGLHPDDTPSPDDLKDAADELELAETMAGNENRVRLARLRFGWALASDGRDRRPAVKTALTAVAAFRSKVASRGVDALELHAALDYLEGRLHLVARDWAAARAVFDRIIEKWDSGHQAALVWRLYCDRVMHADPGIRLRAIDLLLTPNTSAPETNPAHERHEVVLAPHLQAELLSERAVILEATDREVAIGSYERALELRPRMRFAVRGLMRCLAANGHLDEANELGARFTERAQAAYLRRGTPLPAGVYVEMGLRQVEAGHFARGIAMFTAAIDRDPSYLFALEALVSALTADGKYETACKRANDVLASQPPSAAEWNGLRVEFGHALVGARRYHDAMVQFDLALSDGAAGIADRARAGVVRIHRITGRFARALECARDGAGGSMTLEEAGWVHAELADYRQALDCFEQAAKQRPGSPSLMRARARTRRLQGSPGQASKGLEADWHTLPAHRQHQLLNDFGWAALELRRYEAATKFFDQALEGSPVIEAAHRGKIAMSGWSRQPWSEIEKIVERAHDALGGERAAVVNEAAVARLRIGELKEALELFARADELFAPPGGPADTRGQVAARLYTAHELITAQALADAEKIVTKLTADGLPDNRDDPRVALLLARLCLARGEVETAVELYGGVIDRWPDNAFAHLGMAQAHVRNGELEAAGHSLDHALGACPSTIYVLEQKAWTLSRRHEERHAPGPADGPLLRQAAELCENLRELEPDRPSALECLAEISALRGHMAVAMKYLNAAERGEDRSVDERCSRAALYYRMGRYDDAVALLADVLEQSGANPRLRLLLGAAYLQSGRNPEAITNLRAAVGLEPFDSPGVISLAAALQSDGRVEDALQVLTAALDRMSGRRKTPLLLARAATLCVKAAASSGRESEVVLDEALEDVDRAVALSSDKRILADAEYHRGVICHQRGRRLAARAAFQRCAELDPGRADARRALLLIGVDELDTSETFARIGGWAIGVLAVLLLILALVSTLAIAHWHLSKIKWDPIVEIAGGALVALVVAATLPRLARLELGGQVTLTLEQSTLTTAPEKVTLALPRLAPMNVWVMAGPSNFMGGDHTTDTQGGD